ncbi:glutaminase, partial [Microbacterium sp. zg.Y909]|uniref:glutaminase n=1 Tax=Microbacterium sp. zg.Y909 TaxID=2969413 RepID=UPI00214B5880
MSGPRDPRTYDLDALRDDLLQHDDGQVNDSIPELAEADPDLCAIALALADGTVRASTQADVPFSVQSAVKPFLFALALCDTGGDALDRIGIEPTGE